jgi:acetyl esterase/lipase
MADETVQSKEDELIQRQLDDRTDTDKWAYPPHADFWVYGMAELYDTLLAPGMSDDEVRSLRQRYLDLWTEDNAALFGEISEEERAQRVQEYWAPGLEQEADAPDVRTWVFLPAERTAERLPVVFWAYGSAFVCGNPEMNAAEAMKLCNSLDSVVVVPDYRLAPDNKYPTALNDVHAAYKWMLENAETLGIDTDRIVLYGDSSGGALILSLTHRLKRYNWINSVMPRAVLTFNACVEDRQMAASNTIVMGQDWGTNYAHQGWRAYLGIENFNSACIGPEAVPGHASGDDFKGLPPCYLHLTEMDSDRDNQLRYASGLLAAGVFCEIHLWAGAGHSTLYLGESEVTKRRDAILYAEFKDAFTYDLRRTWQWT